MTVAERLAREIWRVAEERKLLLLASGTADQLSLARISYLLDRACTAIGTGDDGRMEAAGLELKAIG